MGRFFARDQMREGPFPEHYEPFESPSPNVLHPEVGPIRWPACSPAIAAAFGTADNSRMSATTYRLTEHFHYWTKHAKINAILQPEQFMEIGEALAKEKGVGPATG